MELSTIGISLRIINAKGYDEKRDALSQDWTKFLKKINSIPLMIPNSLEDVNEFLESFKLDGIILSGGDNIGDYPERDKTEDQIIKYSIKKKIPLFGVCRGMQVLNAYFHGSITIDGKFNHVGKPHHVLILNNKISELLNSDKIIVNSFHHNKITEKSLGNDLTSFAECDEDKTIEGFIHSNLPIAGVMWHPERDPNSYNQILVKKTIQKEFW